MGSPLLVSLQEKELNASEDLSSQDSAAEPWDTVFNRATNTYKKREKKLPPKSAGRVSGFGTSMKFTEYYKEDAKKRRERKNQSAAKDKAEVEELKLKVKTLEEKVDEKAMDKLLEEKLRAIIPPGLMEGLAVWNAGGRQGPINVPSFSGSNSSINVNASPDLVTPPATIAAAQPQEIFVAQLPLLLPPKIPVSHSRRWHQYRGRMLMIGLPPGSAVCRH